MDTLIECHSFLQFFCLRLIFDPLIGRVAFFNTAAYQLPANILPALGVRKLRSGDREFGISVCDTFVASAVQFHNIEVQPTHMPAAHSPPEGH